jgi:hypothetical protein
MVVANDEGEKAFALSFIEKMAISKRAMPHKVDVNFKRWALCARRELHISSQFR